MLCSFCKNKAVYKRQSTFYCREHFINYFLEKVRKTIQNFSLLEPGETVGVGISGGKDSVSLMHVLSQLKELKLNLIGIHIDEGIKGYRDVLTNFLEELARKYKWNIKIYSFKDYFGFTLDEAVKLVDVKPCTICGVWRRWIFWKASQDLKLDKVGVGHNLNDEAQTFIINLLEGNLKDLAKGGPKVGIVEELFVPRVKPFFLVTKKETTIYSLLNEFYPPTRECPYIRGQTRDFIRSKLYSLENTHPGFQESLINGYINEIKKLRNIYQRRIKSEVVRCSVCGYPSTRELCRACELREIVEKNAGKN